MKVLEYVYVRIKNIYMDDDDNNVKKLFLFAGLTKVTTDEQRGTNKKHVDAVISKVIEVPVTDALPTYLELKNKDVRVVIEEHEFNQLEQLSETDIEAFFTYKTSD